MLWKLKQVVVGCFRLVSGRFGKNACDVKGADDLDWVGRPPQRSGPVLGHLERNRTQKRRGHATAAKETWPCPPHRNFTPTLLLFFFSFSSVVFAALASRTN